MVRAEVNRRHGDDVIIDYIDTAGEGARTEHAEMIAQIQDRELVYPVTVVDGAPLYDGAVSFPAILRAVESRLEAASTTG